MLLLSPETRLTWAVGLGIVLATTACGPSPIRLNQVRTFPGADRPRSAVVALNYRDVEVRGVDGTEIPAAHFGTAGDVLLLTPGPHKLVIRGLIRETHGNVVHESWTSPLSVPFSGRAGGTYRTRVSLAANGSFQIVFDDVTDRVTILD